jgi:ligand-binding sensor domain-containing protein
VGTSNGLVRYDGSRMKVFQYFPGKDSSIIESTVTALFESSDSLLWIGYMGSFSVYNSFTGNLNTTRKPTICLIVTLVAQFEAFGKTKIKLFG